MRAAVPLVGLVVTAITLVGIFDAGRLSAGDGVPPGRSRGDRTADVGSDSAADDTAGAMSEAVEEVVQGQTLWGTGFADDANGAGDDPHRNVFPCVNGTPPAPLESSVFYTPPDGTINERVLYHILAPGCDGTVGLNLNRRRRWLRVWDGSLARFRLKTFEGDDGRTRVTVYAQCQGVDELLIRSPRSRTRVTFADVRDPAVVRQHALTLAIGEFVPGAITMRFPCGRYLMANDGNVAARVLTAAPSTRDQLDASWLLIARSAYDAFMRGGTRARLPWNAVELPPSGERHAVPAVFDPPTPAQPTCSRPHRGCCTPPKHEGFRQPVRGTLRLLEAQGATGTAAALPPRIHVLIISSAATYPARRHLVASWALGAVVGASRAFAKVYVSIDCRFPDLYDPAVNYAAGGGADGEGGGDAPAVEWLVGPSGPASESVSSRLLVRVLRAADHIFRAGGFDWFFMVDDDTYVVPVAVHWVVRSLPAAGTRPYLIGHTSEWATKVQLHGDMPFGGGGVLINRVAIAAWRALFTGNSSSENVDAMMRSGRCSSAGGDGAVCRCLVWAMLDQAKAGAASEETAPTPPLYVDWRGMHQLDTADSHVRANMRLYNTACPRCPGYDDLVSLWMLDVVGRQPLVSIHHLLGFSEGALFPDLHGAAVTRVLAAALDELPPLLLMRRVCGRSAPPHAHTVCVNLGYAVQVFPASVSPDEAMTLLDRRRDTHGGGGGGGEDADAPDPDPIAKLTYVRARPALAVLSCMLFYRHSGVYFYRSSEARIGPSYLPACAGSAKGAVDVAARTFAVSVDLEGAAAFEAVLDITDVL